MIEREALEAAARDPASSRRGAGRERPDGLGLEVRVLACSVFQQRRLSEKCRWYGPNSPPTQYVPSLARAIDSISKS